MSGATSALTQFTTSHADQPWAEDGLEKLGRCPVCAETSRAILYDDLWDNTFFVAPGRWTMWQCSRCNSGYLDPRPGRETIARAYERYYTHASTSSAFVSGALTPLQKWRTALKNGYLNRRYGTEVASARPAGYRIGKTFSRLTRYVDFEFRFLPSSKATGEKPKLLDLGCGAGDFLVRARSAGWDAHGVDFDPVAVDHARSLGVNATVGGIDQVAGQGILYDAITMSHVIEHVHDPVQTIEAVFALLKPGGYFYIETPNLAAYGRQIHGRHWRGLEPPRHLVIFETETMRRVLKDTGFTKITLRRNASALVGLGDLSLRIAAGLDPYSKDGETGARPNKLMLLRSAVSRRRTEFMMFSCYKPSKAAS